MQTSAIRVATQALFTILLMSSSIYAIPGVITVTNTNDTGAGSLRNAITTVNSDPHTPHIINFNISGSGPFTIQPASALPAITASYTVIDGTSQSGWSASTPQIIINGSSLTPYTVNGLSFNGVSNCLVNGLVINGGFNNGIYISDAGVGANHNAIVQCFIGTDHTGSSASPNYNGITISGSTNYTNNSNNIGGTTSIALGNLISGNTNYGIALETNVNNTFIANNHIGTNLAGTAALGNGAGGVSVVGSLVPLDAEQCSGTTFIFDVISGNGGPGITLGQNTTNSFGEQNFIGTNAAGSAAVPNTIGILLQGSMPNPSDPTNGAVSYNSFSTNNVISGNSSHGIVLASNTTNSSFESNFIGTDLTGTIAIGNKGHGILIQGSSGAPCTQNNIGWSGNGNQNIIAHNGSGTVTGYGILIDGNATTPDTLNAILGNNIYNNTLSGIALLNNSNNLQAAPTINNVVVNSDGSAVTISATAPSTPSGATFNLDFFINSTDRTPLTEGQTPIGSVSPVNAGATIIHLFALNPATSSNWISATATNLNNSGQPGDSSPYCSNFAMAVLPEIIPAFMFQN